MASSVENSNASEIEAATSSQVTLDGAESVELGEGRVWRRGNVASTADKQNNTGPVLRTTVKPVKRFRPDSSNDKTNPSPSRKKRLKSSGTSVTTALKSDESTTLTQSEASTKSKTTLLSSAVSPERKASPPEANKNEKSNGSETQGDERKDAPVKKKRVWEQWSVDDKNYFFEAVAMYGKDFEAIRTAIAQKHRKKGEDCLAKTKDQVRHLYYRTWTMISKMIDSSAYPLNINKAFQELYAVINYGELRKKLGGNLKKKGIEKLNELIRDGTTSARFKGKNFRIKTPSCRALKKMNPEYQGKEGIHDMPLVSDTRRMKIPLHVTIELCPLTMADWNQVHSIAHNPRLRVRLSVESPLSTLFSFLERKWKPLGGRILSFVEQGQLQSHSAIQKTSSSQWDGTLILQTPPDVSVNTRIMVFQVVNNKAHCVVSYALRKSTQISHGTERAESVIEPELKKIDDTEIEGSCDTLNQKLQSIGCLSESEAVDSCLSSEEDYDYDSATEDAPKDCTRSQQQDPGNCFMKQTTVAAVNTSEVQSLDTTFTLKDKESTPDSPSPNTHTSRDEAEPDKNFGDVTTEDFTPLAPNTVVPEMPVMHKFAENVQTEVFEEGPIDKSLSEDFTSPKQNNHPVAKELNTVNDANITCDSNTLLSPDQPLTGRSKKRKKLLVSSKLFGEPAKGKRQRNTKRNKSFIKMVQNWNANDCGKTTLAEVYMMLGKPSVFRLCYHWLKTASQGIDSTLGPSCESQAENRNTHQLFPLSTGLAALIQTASLSSAEGEEKKTGAEMVDQRVSKSVPKTKSAAVQCDIMKPNHKADERSRSQMPATYNPSNPHGRGISKIIPVETVIVDNLPISGFAVPAVPVNRPRRIAANPNKPVQGTKVSAETMNWLLQRERSRSSRMLRRPIVVDRSSNQRSNRVNNRPMKTFSIVTKGPNKIGFLPSQPVLAPKILNSNPQDGSDSPTSQPQIAEKLAFNSLDKLLNDNFTDAVNGELLSGNLLMQAAKEAGVAPPTPVKTSEQQSTSNKVVDSASPSPMAELLSSPSAMVGETVPCSVSADFSIDSPLPGQTDKDAIANSGGPLHDRLIQSSTVETSRALLNALSQDLTPPTTNPMVYPVNVLGSSPTRPSPSSLGINPAVVYSLPELSWPGHDISSSAFPIMSETFIDKLVDGEADVVLSSLNSGLPQKQTKLTNESSSGNRQSVTTPTLLDEGSNGPSLSRMSFDLQMTPVKSTEEPVHPWTINTNSRESIGLGNLLNTPQKIVPCDSEDSLYGIGTSRDFSLGKNKETTPVADVKSRSQEQVSPNFLTGADSVVDIHLQSLINENSVDLVSKFQDLVRHTTDCDEMSALANDENARDGHVRIDASFQSSDVMSKIINEGSK